MKKSQNHQSCTTPRWFVIAEAHYHPVNHSDLKVRVLSYKYWSALRQQVTELTFASHTTVSHHFFSSNQLEVLASLRLARQLLLWLIRVYFFSPLWLVSRKFVWSFGNLPRDDHKLDNKGLFRACLHGGNPPSRGRKIKRV